MPTTVMTSKRGSGQPSPRPFVGRLTGRQIVLAIVCLLVWSFFIGLLGYSIHSSTKRQVRVEKTFTGTVSAVGNNGRSGCVKPNGGGRPVCSRFFLTPGSAPLKIGQQVGVAYEWINSGKNAGDLLLVYPPG